MMELNGLIPARFLTIVSQLILTIVIFTTMNGNINSCMPFPGDYNLDSYNSYKVQLTVAVSLSIAFLAFEIIGTMGGISTFMPSQGLISTATHASGTILLVLFELDVWCASDYWYVFAFCAALPFVTECLVWIGVFGLKKTI